MPSSMLHADVAASPLQLHVLAGAVPDDIAGHVFVSGVVASPSRPLFTGESVLYRIDFDADAADAVRCTHALLRTPCLCLDEALQADDHGGLLAFRDLGLTRMSPLLGVRAMLGTAPVPLQGRLIVTSDVGRPWEVDPISLELVTPIGKVDEWQGAVPAPWLFPLIMTSAHPAEDPHTGELFTANYAAASAGGDFFHLVRWRAPGPVEHFRIVDSNGDPLQIEQCVHQIAVTRDHVIVQDSAFLFEMRQIVIDACEQLIPTLPLRRLLGGRETLPHRPTSVFYIIHRRDLDGGGGPADAPTPVPAVRVELPGESVHFLAQYDDSDGGSLTLIVPHTPTMDVSETIRRGDRMLDGGLASEYAGLPTPCALTPGTIAVHTIDPRTGSVTLTRTVVDDALWGLGLNTPAPADPTLPIETVYFNTSGFFRELVPQRLVRAYAERVDEALMPDGRSPHLLALAVATGQLARYACPHGWALLSPIFVPRGGDPTSRAGYVVCIAHAAANVPRGPDTSGEEVWIFDGDDITRGPICRLGHPSLDFTFTVHASWTPTLRPSPRDVQVSITDDLDLEWVIQRSFGAASLSETFNSVLGSTLQHDVVARLLADHVFPRFDPKRQGPATTR